MPSVPQQKHHGPWRCIISLQRKARSNCIFISEHLLARWGTLLGAFLLHKTSSLRGWPTFAFLPGSPPFSWVHFPGVLPLTHWQHPSSLGHHRTSSCLPAGKSRLTAVGSLSSKQEGGQEHCSPSPCRGNALPEPGWTDPQLPKTQHSWFWHRWPLGFTQRQSFVNFTVLRRHRAATRYGLSAGSDSVGLDESNSLPLPPPLTPVRWTPLVHSHALSDRP